MAVVSMPKETLGETLHRQLVQVKPGEWYDIGLMLDLMEELDARVGPNALRQMGRKLFQLSHEAHAKTVASSASQILNGFDGLYRRANRGEDIGGWSVLQFGPGRAVLEKTTPHHCALEEGITVAALNCVDVPATVTQEQCFRKGADSCVFVVTSFVTDKRWA